MALLELQGQTRASTLLGASLAKGQVHHAYLFAGPEGVGKTLAARLLAQALNCESPAAVEAAKRGSFVDDPCGTCGSCRRISDDPKKHAHPLVLWVDTEVQMQANGLYSPDGERTASRAIGVRILRELVIPRVSLRAVGGRRKVAIIMDVEFTEAAQNAFLKTLEEPPADTTFIILSSSPDALKPTIRSRCSRVTFQPLPMEVVAERVAKERGLSMDEARLCASIAQGSLGGALEVDEKFLEARRSLILSIEETAQDDYAGWLALAETLGVKDKVDLTLDTLERWFHDVSLLAAGASEPATNLDLAPEARAAAQRLGVREAVHRLELIQRARWMLERHVQPRLTLERLFLAFAGISPLGMSEE